MYVDVSNSLISWYVHNDEETEAPALFNQMLRTRVSTLATPSGACSSLAFLILGKQIISRNEDIVFVSARMNMYHKCGSPYDACKFFGELGA